MAPSDGSYAFYNERDSKVGVSAKPANQAIAGAKAAPCWRQAPPMAGSKAGMPAKMKANF